MSTLSKTENLICDLTVFTSGQREAHIEQAIRLRNAMTGMETTADGFKVYFQPTAIPEEILAFARDEQQCCGFLREAEVYRETEGKQRMVLSLKTSAEGASAWTGAFFTLAQSPISFKETAAVQGQTKKWAWTALIGGIMCLACVLPIPGATLVARGLIPPHWNVGEVFYLIVGVMMIGVWLVVRRYRSARSGSSATCGC